MPADKHRAVPASTVTVQRSTGPPYQLSYTRAGKSTPRFVRPGYVTHVKKKLVLYKQFHALNQKWVTLDFALSQLCFVQARRNVGERSRRTPHFRGLSDRYRINADHTPYHICCASGIIAARSFADCTVFRLSHIHSGALRQPILPLLSFDSPMNRVQLIGVWYSGTARDLTLVADRLEKLGFEVTSTVLSDFRLPAKVARRLRELVTRVLHLNNFRRPRYSLSLFFQEPLFWWMPNAAINCLIPNQEWFTDYGLRLLSSVDEVWCKTHTAERIFRLLGCECRYIGFTSEDRYLPEYDSLRDYTRFLHVGGVSAWKGTQVLVDTWLRHPEWPHLTVTTLMPLHNLPQRLPNNLTVLSRHLPDSELRKLQNTCGINIQPTEMEGFGHTIVEAMSAKAVVATTDGEPMNELVTAQRGFYIRSSRIEKHYLGTRHFVSPEAIESTVDSIQTTDLRVRVALGESARAWFKQNDREFSSRLEHAMRAHLP
jgi:hypothetical protein